MVPAMDSTEEWGAAACKTMMNSSPTAARATTNYIMFEWLAKRQGVDTSKIHFFDKSTGAAIR